MAQPLPPLPSANPTVTIPRPRKYVIVSMPTSAAINCVNKQFKHCGKRFHHEISTMLLCCLHVVAGVGASSIMADGWRHVGIGLHSTLHRTFNCTIYFCAELQSTPLLGQARSNEYLSR